MIDTEQQDLILEKSIYQRQLDKYKGKAAELLIDKQRLDPILDKMERRLRYVPKVGKYLAEVPVMISLVRDAATKEYTKVPYRLILGILAALLYFLAPIDLITDLIPLAGQLDDALVVGFVYKLAKREIEDYKVFRRKRREV